MSAFFVSKKHIDTIVRAALIREVAMYLTWKGTSGYQKHGAGRSYMEHNCADSVGRMLWQANLDSVKARYPDEDYAGEEQDVETYRHPAFFPAPEPVQALKAVNCLQYQSCEVDDWEETEAYRFLQNLAACLVAILPGYKEAEWSIDDD
jgi:hypothetical protein